MVTRHVKVTSYVSYVLIGVSKVNPNEIGSIIMTLIDYCLTQNQDNTRKNVQITNFERSEPSTKRSCDKMKDIHDLTSE